jgi:soluble lytic murein transglycosylase
MLQPSRLIALSCVALLAAAAMAVPDRASAAAAAQQHKPKAAATSTPPAKPAAKTTSKTPSKTAGKSDTRIPLPRPRPSQLARAAPASAPLPVQPAPPAIPLPAAESAGISASDVAAVKQALDLIKRGNTDAATAIERTLQDPVAAKVVEWVVLRSDANSGMSFERFAGFVRANPTWPSTGLFRRRAEASLWDDNREPAVVRLFFATQKPATAKGRFVLARALLAEGDRKTAEAYVREAWRNDAFSSEVERAVQTAFGDVLTRADYKARMDQRLYAEDVDAALRAAAHLDGNEQAIARARAAVIKKAGNAAALLDAVPSGARGDPGYLFQRIQWLRRADKIAEAAQLMLTAPRDASKLYDLDQWWVERRFLARKLLDIGDARTAYRVASDAVPPPKENYKVDQNFTAGWIALRFLNDPATALSHFARIAPGIGNNPHALARAGYWQGRALEALDRTQEARAQYEAAARHSTVYYGQIARARLGLPDLPLRGAPPSDRQASRLEIVRAAEILYAVDARDLIASMMADLGEKTTDVAALAALGEVTARHSDPRGMLQLGKGALGRGFAFDHYAFPTVGLPRYTPIGPPIEPSVAYSIARQESAFNQKDLSTANAMGLMQVTPAAGKYVTKKFGVAYDQKRLAQDATYNMQIGAAELGDLIQYYNGS